MKRILIISIVIALIVFGPNLYYTQQVKKQLNTSATMMRAMGGSLDYSDVSITLDGSVLIDNLRVTAPGLDDSITIKQISLDTGSFLGIHKLAADVRNNRMPAQLALSFNGMEVPLAGDSYKQMNALGTDPSESLLTAQCGDRSTFSASDYSAMGYGNSVLVNTSLSYRIINDGQWLELSVKSAVERMNEMTVKLDVSLGARSRDTMALASAMSQAQLDEVRIDYRDQGYMKRVLDFCQQESGLERSEFLAHHLEAWQQTLELYGFSAGENTLAAYSKFLEQPERFSLSAKPISNAEFMHLANFKPEHLAYQFDINMQVNGRAAGPLDLSWVGKVAEPPQPTTTNNRSTTANEQRLRHGETQRQAIAVRDLRNALNQDVVLRLNNGRTVEGRIVELLDTALQLQIYHPGGHMTMPVNYAQIDEAYLK